MRSGLLFLLSLAIALVGRANGCAAGGTGTTGSHSGINGVETPGIKQFLEYVQVQSVPKPTIGSPGGPLLNCPFNTAQEACSWFNADDDQLDWRLGRFKKRIPDNFYQQIFKKSDRPDKHFLFAASSQRDGSDTAVLVADIDCQIGRGQLTFSHWQSDEAPDLRVCLYDESGPNCQEVINRETPNPYYALIGPSGNGKFQIRLEASGFTVPSVVIVDNLSYTYQRCNNNGDKTTLPPATRCSFLDCDFNDGNTCAWNPTGYVHGSQSAQWNVGGGRTGNPHTGIQRTDPFDQAHDSIDGFAFVGRDAEVPPGALYVLDSPPVRFLRDAYVDFDFYIRSSGAVLEACIDSTENCPVRKHLDGSNVEKYWRKGTLMVPADPNVPKTIKFVVRNLRSNLFAAVDHIRVESDGLCSREP